MLYWSILLTVVLLTGSGVVGSDAFLIGIIIGGVLCCIGYGMMLARIEKEEREKGDDKNKRY